ncbi:MAG: GNAT family N-acetyltransferase [Anaerolineae bacterium]
MSSPYAIHRAAPTLADAQALFAAERASLADSSYTPEEIAAILGRPEHYAYFALADGEPAGFCSCLETPYGAGTRLEIDMLGVVPAQRGRGLAKGLIRQAVAEARERGVCSFRAAVALDNLASQGAFRGAGLAAPDPPAELTVYTVRGNSPVSFLPEGWSWSTLIVGRLNLPRNVAPPMRAYPGVGEVVWVQDGAHHLRAAAECLRVQTLAYTGLWLERMWWKGANAGRLLARATVERAKVLDLDEVGCLVPHAAYAGTEAPLLQCEGFEVEGRYLVFTAEER